MPNNNFGNVNHLVLNFYPDGYSIAVKLNEFPVFTSETILETAKISYDETSLLDYIENEELPPLLVEMIDSSPKLSQYKIWHNGCLILEVRDKINNNSHENAHFVLLKPTNLSMLNDVLKLTESSSWSTQDRLQLESQIVLHNAPPLFLEPNVNKYPPQDEQLQVQVIHQQLESSPFKPGSEDDGKHSSPSSSSPSTSSFDNINDGIVYSKHKRKFPHHTNLKRNQKRSCNETNDNRIISSSAYGCDYTTSKQQQSDSQSSPVNLPPELILQQFLATKRARKRNISIGNLARFHRYRRRQ